MTDTLRDRLGALVRATPEIPMWSHSANMWIYKGEQIIDGTIADHRWLQDLSRWADEVAALAAQPAPAVMGEGAKDKRIAMLSKLVFQLIEPSIQTIMEVYPHHPVLERIREALAGRTAAAESREE